MATRRVADGRLIPLIILDTSSCPDIEDAVRAHCDLGPGDVRSTWAAVSRFDPSRLSLALELLQPSACTIVIEFDLPHHGGLVDQIVRTQGLYLQPGRPGDLIGNSVDRDRILIEVPARAFCSEWERILRKALVKDFRRQGLSKGDAKDATESYIEKWRNLTAPRMGSEFD